MKSYIQLENELFHAAAEQADTKAKVLGRKTGSDDVQAAGAKVMAP
jgi:hypothetical protein